MMNFSINVNFESNIIEYIFSKILLLLLKIKTVNYRKRNARSSIFKAGRNVKIILFIIVKQSNVFRHLKNNNCLSETEEKVLKQDYSKERNNINSRK